MKKILASMLSAAIVSAMLLTGCGSSGSAPAADASAAGSTPAADNTGGTATDYPTKQISMITVYYTHLDVYKRQGNIHADPAASLGKLCGMSVLAERRYKLDVLPEKGQVVCDIACNAAGGEADVTGVGILLDQRCVRMSEDIHIDSADYNDIGIFLKDVALALNQPFFHQVGIVHGHRRTGDVAVYKRQTWCSWDAHRTSAVYAAPLRKTAG